MMRHLQLLLLSLLCVISVGVTAWNCVPSMITTQFALDTIATPLNADALSYQLMYTGLSAFPELPCWAINISAHPGQTNYVEWGQYLQPLSSSKSASSSSSSSASATTTKGVLISKALPAANATLTALGRNSGQSVPTDLQYSSPVATLGFWLAMTARLVAAAHDPAMLCQGGDGFFVKDLSGQNVSINSVIESVGGLLTERWTHPIKAHPNQLSKLQFLADSLHELDSNVTVAQRNNLVFADWAAEGLALCNNVVYQDLVPDQQLTTEYVLRLRTALQRQLLLSGYRMAKLFDQAL